MQAGDFLVEFLRQQVDLLLHLLAVLPQLHLGQRLVAEKLFDMTKLGWPVAQPRLTSRPLASTMMRLPLGQIT